MVGSGGDLGGIRRPTGPSNLPTSLRLTTAHAFESERRDFNPVESDLPLRDSSYGVKSLPDAAEASLQESIVTQEEEEDKSENNDHSGRRRSTLRPFVSNDGLQEDETRRSSPFNIVEASSSPHSSRRPSLQHSLSQSMTSMSLDSQAPLSSLPSSPKSTSYRSIRPSDEDSLDESGSQAVASSSEDEAPVGSSRTSPPQLVMPSIRLPSRRPFTAKGRAMGRLKIMIAGDSGTGKSSLVRSILQNCDDIVHVDPVTTHASRGLSLSTNTPAKSTPSLSRPTRRVQEIFASTKPYPTWWTKVEETTLLQHRKSLGDNVLDRNICIVDTPGYSHGISKMEAIDCVIQYIESQLKRSCSPSAENESELMALLGGNGGTQVDLVLYLCDQDPKDEDLIFLERLTKLTNVIPVISKSDTRTSAEIEELRRNITDRMRLANLSAFKPLTQVADHQAYTVCTVPANDDEVIDASLLMSSDYIPPLSNSDLKMLLDHIFQSETISCLRHLSSRKLIQAKRMELPQVSWPGLQRSPGVSPYLQAKMADHIYQEERLAQIKLAKWASDLQRSLQLERVQFETVSNKDRTDWLMQKLNERPAESLDLETNGMVPHSGGGTCVPPFRIERSQRRRYRTTNLLNNDDPLGLLGWSEAVQRNGWAALQVAGGFGVLGALVMWAAKSWGNMLGWGSSGSTGGEQSWTWGLFASGDW